MRPTLLAAVACSVAASQCTFPLSMNGTECWGLSQAPNVTDAPSCQAACCASGPSCQTWQWCPPGGSCPTPGTCWIGPLNSCHAVADWIGGAVAEPDVVNMTGRFPLPPPVQLPGWGNNVTPTGSRLSVDTVGYAIDGVPWLQVMGEFQFSRTPAEEWADNLARMKASGVTVVGSYIFWLHHQEQQGIWDWSGQRNLTAFVQAVAAAGMRVFLRVGPWAHGEARHGGFPDWLVNYPGINLRSTDPVYLGFVQTLYNEIGNQTAGLYWKDGGPIIAAQLENEWGGSYTYLQTLLAMARKAGIAPAAFTKTGWPGEPEPWGMLLPYYGGYAADFWTGGTSWDDNNGVYLFNTIGDATNGGPYPALLVEMGGGMTSAYHRRVTMHSDDVAADALTQLGSGSNCLGYYIYKGGTNPEGVLSTMEESQLSGYSNDLQIKSYDYFAPIAEYGNVHGHYHSLRRIHLFVDSWGSALAPLSPAFPSLRPANDLDTTVLKWAVRSDGQTGFVFVNNFLRDEKNPLSNVSLQGDLSGVTLSVVLSDRTTLAFPATAPNMTVQGGLYFLVPFNWQPLPSAVPGLVILQSTLNPICTVPGAGADGSVLVWGAPPGIPVELLIAAPAAADVNVMSCSGSCTLAAGVLTATGLVPGTTFSLVLAVGGANVSFLVLDWPSTLGLWSGRVSGVQRLALTAADPTATLLFNDSAASSFRLISEAVATSTVAFYPPLSTVTVDGKPVPATTDGVFASYAVPTATSPALTVATTLVQPAGPPRNVTLGPAGRAQAPNEDGTMGFWAQAAVYNLSISVTGSVPPNLSALALRLTVSYTGDAARLYVNGSLVADNFYNAQDFVIGINRYAALGIINGGSSGSGVPVQLRVLPLSRDAPIYVAWPPFPPGQNSTLVLGGVSVVQASDVTVQAA